MHLYHPPPFIDKYRYCDVLEPLPARGQAIGLPSASCLYYNFHLSRNGATALTRSGLDQSSFAAPLPLFRDI